MFLQKPIECVKSFKNSLNFPDELHFIRKGNSNQWYFQLEIHSLTIYETKMKDDGEYVCTVKLVLTTCKVNMKGKLKTKKRSFWRVFFPNV